MSDNLNDTSVINYLKIFFRRKELIIIPAFVGLILGICSGVLLPKKYKSSTIMLVEEGKSDNPLFNNLAVSTTVQQRMSNIRESILGWNNLVSLVKRLKMDTDVNTVQEFERLILSIRKNIVFGMKGRNVIELAYVDEDPVQTQAVVKNLTDIFIERNVEMQNRETSDAIGFIEEQLKVYEGKILSAEIAKLEDQLNTLLVDSTEKHPIVRTLRERVDTKKQELEKKNLQYTRSDVIHTEQATNNPIISEIKMALDTLEKNPADPDSRDSENNLAKVMLIDKLTEEINKDQVLARDVAVNERIYNMLLQRLETAKITQRLQSSKEGTKYTILDPPRIPFKPFEPNKPLVIFIGFFLGAAIGAACVFVVEFFDKSFIDVEEAKDFLGVPLFGAISKITTEESLRQSREKQAWLYGLTFIAGTVVVIVTVALSNFVG